MLYSQYDYQIKIVLVGDSGVGKTTFFKGFTYEYQTFNIAPTLGVDFDSKIIIINDKKIKVHIWDTAGMERFRTLTINYYRGANIIMLFYDTTHRTTFDNLESWIISIKSKVDTSNCKIALIGTKTDLIEERVVSYEEAHKFADKNMLIYCEVCSLVRINKFAWDNINNIIETITKTIDENNYTDYLINDIININPPKSTKTNCCIID